jgi:hypothetical protein
VGPPRPARYYEEVGAGNQQSSQTTTEGYGQAKERVVGQSRYYIAAKCPRRASVPVVVSDCTLDGLTGIRVSFTVTISRFMTRTTFGWRIYALNEAVRLSGVRLIGFKSSRESDQALSA